MSSAPSARIVLPLLLLSCLAGPGVGTTLGAPAQVAPQRLPIAGRWCPSPPPLPSLQPPASQPGAGPPSTPAPASGCVDLEVPRTWHQYALGLQLRDPLPPERGMWFTYRPAREVRFWMHRTPNPLDLIFVRDGRVVAIEAGAPPCMRLPCPNYGPPVAVDGVLELAAGEAGRRALAVGSPLRVELFRPFGPTAPAPD
jgi:uncharacterized membrane protein (UPF0127 family)